MKQFWKSALASLALMGALWGGPASAQGPAPTDPHMQWWRDARFGMFIHWGPISVMGQEIGWSRSPSPFGPNPDGIPATTYDNLYKQFNPN
ncbi:MAG: alpha-L-fucosidase, partial [Capsulimonas sp.]|nr:alpha-L-fucosidase [Capsulimonas sp.]